MYLPPHFTESNPEILQQVMSENSFATVVTADDGVPFASHVPVLDDGEAAGGSLRIRGHFARANPHWKQLADRAACSRSSTVRTATCRRHGTSRDRRTCRPGTTWRCTRTAARGCSTVPRLRAVLAELVEVHERDAPEPWRFDTMAAELVDKLLGAIVGFEIAVDRIEGKLKLSQNRSTEDQRRVREQLNASDDPTARDVGRWMAR